MTDHALAAYEELAPHYDLFTAHHRYDEWTALLERLARDAGLSGRRLLDVACGTGKSFRPYLGRGYAVTACDLSPAMARIADEHAGGAARVEVHDMRTLPVLGEFDLVQCLDDALNYLLRPAEVAAALRAMGANLAPGGVLLFDVNTLRAYRTFFASTTVVQEPCRVLVWEGRADAGMAAGDDCEAELAALVRDGDTWRRSASLHRQRHHAEAVVRRAVADAGLAVAGRYGLLLDGTLSDSFDELHHTKAIYVVTARGERR